MDLELSIAVTREFDALHARGLLTERRPGQLEVASAVAKAIDDPHHLVVHAGTGIGKTLAYLIPVILSGKPAVVSTATKSLQEQVARRDLPALREALGRELSWVMLKGRGAYICLQRVTETEGESVTSSTHRRLIEWAHVTETGDRDELGIDVPDTAWRRLSVRGDQCPGRDRCPSGDSCFAERARTRAAKADIVVTNHYVYAASLIASRRMLPDHEIAVFDEAHQLDEAVRQTTSTYVDPARIGRMIAMSEDGPIARLRDLLGPFAGRYLSHPPTGLDAALEAAGELVSSVAAEQRALAADGHFRARRRAHTLGLVAENLILSRADTDRPRWVEGKPHEPVLRSFASGAGAHLVLGDPSQRTAILASATFGTELASSLELGSRPVAAVHVPSPFAYHDQAILYCAADLPDPRSPGFAGAAHTELAMLINAAGGRTLALFTSRNSLRAAVEAVAPQVEGVVLVQGDLSRPELLRRFRDDSASCLFGTIGLASGTDVPGDALTLVTLDRLPFPPVGDPYYEARRAASGASAFRDVDLRHARTVMAQAAGRLIRTGSDRGVFAVLDSRLASAKYRWTLVRALPPMRRSRDRETVCEFLRCCAAPLPA